MRTPEIPNFEMERMERNLRRIADTVSNIAVREDLPPVVFVLVPDEVKGELFGLPAYVRYTNNIDGTGGVAIGVGGISVQFGHDVPMAKFVDAYIENNEGVPLLCNEQIAEEIIENSTLWLDRGNYKLVGRRRGTLEMYIA